ncbi:hypothetical protein D3C86_1451740 [compost metagenome]
MNVLAIAALATTVASPAFAQMKTSAPAKTAAPAAKAAAPATAEQFRPTSFLGLERAQTHATGVAVMGLSGLDLAYGLNDSLEIGGSAGLSFATTPTFSLNPSVYGKALLMNTDPMSLALGAKLNLGLSNAGGVGTNTVSADVFLPLTFWAAGPGRLTVMPAVTLGTGGFGNGNMSVGLGYELPVTSKWTLMLADTYNFAGNNTLTLANRVGLTPNLTADVGSISLNGSTFTVNLLAINAYFGGRAGDVRSAWGL